MPGYDFTDRLRYVISHVARDEAWRLKHEYVGTEHLLLGMIREGQGVGASTLTHLGIDASAVTDKIDSVVKPGDSSKERGAELPYTSRAKKVLELALMEAREQGHTTIGTGHLLLGLLREEKGIAPQVLTYLGVTLEMARTETLRLAAEGNAR